jgi:hypothetical protein
MEPALAGENYGNDENMTARETRRQNVKSRRVRFTAWTRNTGKFDHDAMSRRSI